MIKITNADEKKLFGNSIFTSVAVGRAYELLRHDLMEHLKEMQETMHFKYCRFHGLFNDEMAVFRRLSDGKCGFQWHYIDKITDNLLSVGLRPFFELGDMPDEMVTGDTHACFWKMNSSEPKDYNEWGYLVENFVRHMVDRYGLDEVKTWYFEVWNEPNIKAFWHSGMQTYYESLYPQAANAVKRVSPQLRVGGPATAGGNHISEFIDYCVKNSLPLDFITTHAYPLGEQCEYPEPGSSPYNTGEYFVKRFEEVKEQVISSPLPDLEIHWTEWNTMSAASNEEISWICNPTVDMMFGAACVVKNMLGVRYNCDSAAYWVASDLFEESGMPHSVFSCTYGLMNIHGIKKATYNAYKLLRNMRGNVMKLSSDEFPPGCELVAAEESGIIRVIACNQHYPEIEQQPDWHENLVIDVPDGEYMITTARIEKGHGSCYETWLDMGMPQDLSKLQEELLRAASVMNYGYENTDAANGELEYEFTLKPDEVIYIEIQKKSMQALPRKTDDKFMKEWNNAQMLSKR